MIFADQQIKDVLAAYKSEDSQNHDGQQAYKENGWNDDRIPLINQWQFVPAPMDKVVCVLNENEHCGKDQDIYKIRLQRMHFPQPASPMSLEIENLKAADHQAKQGSAYEREFHWHIQSPCR
jgi:hypothetical protein